MKKLFLFFFIFSLFFSLCYAQVQMNFGSMQPDKVTTISPGEDKTIKLFFFNEGNRISHISLKIIEGPKELQVSIDPPIHTTKLKVSGIETEIEENLYVKPSGFFDEIPDEVDEQIEYVSTGQGYIAAKSVNIIIKAPEDIALGKSYELKIEATANWVGQSGAVSLGQQREFDYKITTISDTFTEEIITQDSNDTETQKKSKLLGIVIMLTIVILGMIIYFIINKLSK